MLPLALCITPPLSPASLWLSQQVLYVLPEYRRKGLAFTCARLVMKKHPGAWHISYNRNNGAGSRLWNKLAETVAASGVVREIEEDGPAHFCLKFTVV